MAAGTFNPQSECCLICGSRELQKYQAHAFDATSPSFVHIVECEQCTFAWQFPLGRSERQSIQFFKSAYADQGQTQSDYFHPKRKREIARLEFEFLSGLPVENHALLEIGAGSGMFAEVAAENGWYVTAVDPVLDITQMKNDPLLTKIQGTAEQLPVHEKYDVIVLWDVVEHLHNPLQSIALAKAHLQKGGWLIIETGNFKSADRLRGGLEHWIYQLDHRWYFSPESIQQIFMDLGFTEFVFCDRVLRPGWQGSVEYSESDWDSLLQSEKKDQHGFPVPFFNASSMEKARKWKMAGLEIFVIATRMLSK